MHAVSKLWVASWQISEVWYPVTMLCLLAHSLSLSTHSPSNLLSPEPNCRPGDVSVAAGTTSSACVCNDRWPRMN
ncbi:hypothetical protein F4775DRAFT_33427 [Biscogniauxia sp. FL1348]|nr:hypothetical protein F4775DRAFT_33427 [Biscogniauxia sp. FL1348]